jgi:hypothetical protein
MISFSEKSNKVVVEMIFAEMRNETCRPRVGGRLPVSGGDTLTHSGYRTKNQRFDNRREI